MNFLLLTTLLLLVVVLPLLLSLRSSKLVCVDRFCVACVLAAMTLGVLMTSGALLPPWLAATLATSFAVGSGLMSLSGFQLLLARPCLSNTVVATVLTATVLLSTIFGALLGYSTAHVVLGTGLPCVIYLAIAFIALKHPPKTARLMPYLLVCSIFALVIGVLHGVRLGLALAGYDLITPTLENQVWLMALQAVRILLLPLFFLSVVLMLHGTIIASLRQMVDTDETTGVLSRRAFLKGCEAQLRPAQSSSAFLILDLDFFKQVNDRHGHAGGDEALVHFVGRVRHVIGADAHFGRLGGEEFGVLLLDVEEARALAIADAICRSVQRCDVRAGQPGAFPITVSIGLAMAEDDEAMADLMSRADAALYAAKETGRNRVCRAESRIDTSLSLARAALSATADEMRDRHLSQQKRRHFGL